MKTQEAFTLIELLIVVAIIGILAAIAVPNFLNAQVRAKVARAEADMRGLKTAIEAYQLDHNAYIAGFRTPNPASLTQRLSPLTTPVSYYSNIPDDPFFNQMAAVNPDFYDTYDYLDAASSQNNGAQTRGYSYRLASGGPDGIQRAGVIHYTDAEGNWGIDYDPSNGLVSVGDIVTVGGSVTNPDYVVSYPLDNYPSN